MTVFDTGWAGRFAGAAGQATIEMRPCLLADRLAFKHLLDQVDTAPRTVQLVAQQLICRAGCRTEAAMHAFAQNLLGHPPGMGCPQFVGEFSIHQNSAYKRPEFRMPFGSKDFLRRRCSASMAGDSGANAPSRQRSDSGER
ncbi:hypothetical protein SDC9_198578 [bioreactor metagenome]|uniref:Uncharacterized protein n=1 Tax=bioreactor metagenome TaxID=1076179 RepID=A0A645II04_9ZZZZ